MRKKISYEEVLADYKKKIKNGTIKGNPDHATLARAYMRGLTATEKGRSMVPPKTRTKIHN